jgi:hypothetical protein
MSVPFDATDLAVHIHESEGNRSRTAQRLDDMEREMNEHIQRTNGMWRDLRSLKWLVRLTIPLILALAGLAPWVTRRVVVDVMTDVGVVKLQPTWQAPQDDNR